MIAKRGLQSASASTQLLLERAKLETDRGWPPEGNVYRKRPTLGCSWPLGRAEVQSWPLIWCPWRTRSSALSSTDHRSDLT